MRYTIPARKDYVYSSKVNGEGTYAEKRYLLWTLRDSSGIINKSENNFKISFTQLYDFTKIKKQFVDQRDIPETSCLFEICENTALMGKALRRYTQDHQTDAHIVEKYCCDSTESSSINSTCGESSFINPFVPNALDVFRWVEKGWLWMGMNGLMRWLNGMNEVT